MGLDMYLYAKKTFPSDSEVTAKILEANSTTLAKLREECSDDYRYLSMWDHETPAERKPAEMALRLAGLRHLVTIDSPSGGIAAKDGSLEVRATCAYWRKANAVHGWFVKNVQGGADECQESPVTRGQLADLVGACRAAIAEYKAKGSAGSMAPTAGFFFGSGDVDEWWLRNMEDTVREIGGLLVRTEGTEIAFSYRASW